MTEPRTEDGRFLQESLRAKVDYSVSGAIDYILGIEAEARQQAFDEAIAAVRARLGDTETADAVIEAITEARQR